MQYSSKRITAHNTPATNQSSVEFRALLSEVLGEGCDERIHLGRQSGRNKYHLDPIDHSGMLYRGSCTSGALNAFSEARAREFFNDLQHTSCSELAEQQRHSLARLIDPGSEYEFEVFFAPSGSDLVYIPLMLSYLAYGDTPVLNLVSCPEEIGSGSVAAARGCYHGEFNQFGDKINKGELAIDSPKIQCVTFPSRHTDGQIVDRNKLIANEAAAAQGASLVGNLVYGSKSGINDDLLLIDEMPDVLWTVDLCQLRNESSLICDLLQRRALVLVTGSKFYQAPPFCGAMLVPKYWIDRVSDSRRSLAAYANIFSQQDIPPALPEVRSQFREFDNTGLRLRWHLAIEEMRAFADTPISSTQAVIDDWNELLSAELSRHPCFELMPDQHKVNPTIVSFRVRSASGFLNHQELKRLFQHLCTRDFGNSHSFDRVFIGQPVQYGEKSFLRLAIGSHDVRKFAASAGYDGRQDRELIATIVEAIDELAL